MTTKSYVVPGLGRAGLGNELFPWLRAAEISATSDRILIAPRWFQLRVGPMLRGERDARQYWRLFHRIGLRMLIRRTLSALEVTVFPDRASTDPSAKYLVVRGMDGYFSQLTLDGPWHRQFLCQQARRDVISPDIGSDYLSVHVRLGDFARSASDVSALASNNSSTPLSWYENQIRVFRTQFPHVAVLVSSDGTDEELRTLLEIPGAQRSNATNALDEIMLMSQSVGLIGSRSTFSAWAAFLGTVPMLVFTGGNAYEPHGSVWEAGSSQTCDDWLRAVAARLGAVG